jgi:tetratricopeptide (TPR) repeat protein
MKIKKLTRLLKTKMNWLLPSVFGAMVGLILCMTYYGVGYDASLVYGLFDLTSDYGQVWAGKNYSSPSTSTSDLHKPDYETAEEWESLGDNYYNDNDFIHAVQSYSKAIQLAPENATYYAARGVAYREMKDYPTAFDDFGKAIEIADGNYSWVFQNRGIAYFELNQYQPAVQDFTQAVKLNKTRYFSYYMRGRIYLRLLAYEKAISDFQSAIEVNQEHAISYSYLGLAYSETQRWEESRNAYTQSLRIDPLNAAIYYYRAVAEEHLIDFPAAVKDYNSYLELSPNASDRSKVMERIQRITTISNP